MPAQSKIIPHDIIETAFKIVRKDGWAKFSARQIAKELNSSTMPIYSKFKSLTVLEEEIVRKSTDLLKEYETKTYTGDRIMDSRIGYVMFARKEYHLFQTINDEKHASWQTKYGDKKFDDQTLLLSQDPRLKDMTWEQLRHLNFLIWIFIHGIAALRNWMNSEKYSEACIIDLIQEGCTDILIGYLEDFKNQAQSETA